MLADVLVALATRKLATSTPMFIDGNGKKFDALAGSNVSIVVDLMYGAER